MVRKLTSDMLDSCFKGFAGCFLPQLIQNSIFKALLLSSLTLPSKAEGNRRNKLVVSVTF